jgi:hypothetical protein
METVKQFSDCWIGQHLAPHWQNAWYFSSSWLTFLHNLCSLIHFQLVLIGGWGYSSVEELFPSTWKALDSNPSTEKKKERLNLRMTCFVLFFSVLFLNRVLLCNPGCPWTLNLPASVCQMLGL